MTGATSRLHDLAEAMCAADPAISKEAALQWLLHSPRGRALFRTHKNEESTVSRTEELRSLAKDGNVVNIAKIMVDEHRNYSLTEAEFTKLMHDHAQRDRREGESADQAFARTFSASTEEGATLRRAHAVVKNFPNVMRTTPMQVGGAAATAVDDPTDALAQLQRLAAEQRRRSPELTIEQAFARVYAATENAELVARERMQNRPVGRVVGAAASI